MSLLPLLVAQCFALIAIWKQKDFAWREASAAFMFCAVPASIALISQTYHISDDVEAFQRWWFLLMLPFAYLLKARLAGGLLMILAAFIAGGQASPAWLFLVAILPLYFANQPFGFQANSPKLGWVLAITLAISMPIVIVVYERYYDDYRMLVAFMSAAILIFLVGGLLEKINGFWQRPFANIGAMGVAVNLLIYTSADIWSEFSRRSHSGNQDVWHASFFPEMLLCFAAIALIWVLIKKRYDLLPLGSMLALPVIATLVPLTDQRIIVFTVLANFCAVAISLWYLWQGIKIDSTSRMNFGLIILMALIMWRFFDQDVSFIVKGLAFIIMGIAFISLNIWQSKRTKR